MNCKHTNKNFKREITYPISCKANSDFLKDGLCSRPKPPHNRPMRCCNGADHESGRQNSWPAPQNGERVRSDGHLPSSSPLLPASWPPPGRQALLRPGLPIKAPMSEPAKHSLKLLQCEPDYSPPIRLGHQVFHPATRTKVTKVPSSQQR